jgi:hypothetical protein
MKIDWVSISGVVDRETVGERTSMFPTCPKLNNSARHIDGEIVHIMCQWFIQDRYDSGLLASILSVLFDTAIDGSGELDIVTPLGEIEGDDGI